MVIPWASMVYFLLLTYSTGKMNRPESKTRMGIIMIKCQSIIIPHMGMNSIKIKGGA